MLGRFGELFAGTINRPVASNESDCQTTLTRRILAQSQDGQDNRLLATTPERYSASVDSVSVFIRAIQVPKSSSQASSTSSVRDEFCSQLLTSSHLASRLRHPHVVACYGMVKSLQPKLLIYERLSQGRLKEFLQNVSVLYLY